MPTIIDSKDAAARLPELLERVREDGEEFILADPGRPDVLLGTIAPGTQEHAASSAEDHEALRRENWARAIRRMEEEGLISRPKPGVLVRPILEVPLLKFEGEPLSETILKDRG